MGIIDLIIIIFAAFYFLKGYKQGLFLSIIKVFAYLLGIFISIHFSSHISSLLFNKESEGILLKTFPFISYTILFFATVFSVHILGKWVNRMLKIPIISPLNKLAGAFLYLGIFTFIASSFLWVGQQINLFNPDSISGSMISSILLPIAPASFEFIAQNIPLLKDSYNSLDAFFTNWSSQISTK